MIIFDLDLKVNQTINNEFELPLNITNNGSYARIFGYYSSNIAIFDLKTMKKSQTIEINKINKFLLALLKMIKLFQLIYIKKNSYFGT